MTLSEARKYYRKHESSAMSQGWIICLNGNTLRPEIMKLDEDPKNQFESDVEAIECVLQNASSSKLCRAAVKIAYKI